jgi:hypothetical protein
MTISEYDDSSIPQQGGGNQEQPVAVKAVAAVDIHHGHDASSDIPVEAQGLTWNDTYYADKNIKDVIAVFDVNGNKMRSSMWVWFTFLIFVFAGTFIFVWWATSIYDLGPFVAAFCFVHFAFLLFIMWGQFTKMSKGINGLHVAVTEEGIRKDMNGYPFGNAFRTTMIVSTVVPPPSIHIRRRLMK